MRQAPVALSKADRERMQQDATALMQKALLHIKIYYPFYGALAERLKLKADWRHPTCYTDAVVLGFNPQFVLSKGWAYTLYVTIHEITHCALGHPFRRKDRRPKEWGEAVDHVTNLALNKDPELLALFAQMGEGLADPRFSGMAAEQVYTILKTEADEKAKQQQQQRKQEQEQQEQQEQSSQQSQGDDGEEQQEQQGPSEQGEEQGEQSQGEGEEGESSEDEGDLGESETGMPGDCLDAGASGERPEHLEEEGEEGEEEQGEGSGHPDSTDDDEEQGAESESSSEPDDDLDNDDLEDDGEGSDDEQDQGEVEVEEGEEQAQEARQMDESELAKLERDWSQSVMTAQLAAGGEIEATMARAIGATQQDTRSFADCIDEFAHTTCSMEESWSRSNRRFSHEYLPSRCAPGVKEMVLGIDTSGSISDAALALMQVAAQKVLDEFGLKSMHVVYCDSRIRGIEVFNAGDTVELHARGGGGTSFHPVLRYALELEQQGADVAGVIYLTDLEGGVSDAEDFAHMQILWVDILAERPRWSSGDAPAGLGSVINVFQ